MNSEFKVLYGEDAEEESSLSARIFSVVINIVIVLLSLVVLMQVTIEPVKIIGTSMENTVFNGETVVINKLYFTPSRGDVVVIDTGNTGTERIIKRVIATSGDKVGFVKDGEYIDLYLDTGDGFTKRTEPYIKERMAYDSGNRTIFFNITVADSLDDLADGKKYVTVGENEIFVLGDNRNVSRDSRYYGTFKTSQIVGKEFVTVSGFWQSFFEFFYRSEG